MGKHRAVIIGAGRVGAGYKWHDDAYTHAGAYRALSDRVELVGIADPDGDRLNAACAKWGVRGGITAGKTIEVTRPDIVSICTQPDPELRQTILDYCEGFGVKAIWCEKPFVGKSSLPVQVNYMRRGDPVHRDWAFVLKGNADAWKLIIYGKDDIHTKCHFEDLAKWWGVKLDYRPFNGPCAYILHNVITGQSKLFDNGGVDGGPCFRAMLDNLLDHIEGKAELWSPAK